MNHFFSLSVICVIETWPKSFWIEILLSFLRDLENMSDLKKFLHFTHALNCQNNVTVEIFILIDVFYCNNSLSNKDKLSWFFTHKPGQSKGVPFWVLVNSAWYGCSYFHSLHLTFYFQLIFLLTFSTQTTLTQTYFNYHLPQFTPLSYFNYLLPHSCFI